ncbi:hypothetical protein [Aquisediminimonas sediminicola]|uniref:hypothetical protein n=1 Tax=Alteraquisediminimonas sediminicola TaxID=2676787 RepID=UPI001C8ED36B|nr:hypothetical protein [Aquisediminimonas sediminicola]
MIRRILDRRMGMALALVLGLPLLYAAPAAAQVFWYPPQFATGPISGGDSVAGLPLPQATQAELDAALVWNLRSGLNVAALKCQQWSGLRLIDNYNDVLVQHKVELAKAYSTLGNYFVRVNKVGGQRKFDDYSTRTYNGFSTANGQRSFCHVAGKVGRAVVGAPKGMFLAVAREQLRELRISLQGYSDPFIMGTDPRRLLVALPRLEQRCWKGVKYNERKCG